MGNIVAPPITYFDSFADEMEGKFGRVRDLISHKGSSGEYHEEIFRVTLRNFLTNRFSVKTGFIFKSKKEVSNQVDILIIDENDPTAYLFQQGDFAIVLPQAVVGAIEVKTSMKKQDFIDSTNNIASCKRLYKYPNQLSGLVFGYTGTNPTDSNLSNWFKDEELKKYVDSLYTPDAFLFFSEACLLAKTNDRLYIDPTAINYRKIFRESEAQKILQTEDGSYQSFLPYYLLLVKKLLGGIWESFLTE